ALHCPNVRAAMASGIAAFAYQTGWLAVWATVGISAGSGAVSVCTGTTHADINKDFQKSELIAIIGKGLESYLANIFACSDRRCYARV
ncbi:MAG: hypothetical protein KBT18_14320, partial [Comamonas sp.]|nr:hypothetical protein [Candidatus Comamonas equi]